MGPLYPQLYPHAAILTGLEPLELAVGLSHIALLIGLKVVIEWLRPIISFLGSNWVGELCITICQLHQWHHNLAG